MEDLTIESLCERVQALEDQHGAEDAYHHLVTLRDRLNAYAQRLDAMESSICRCGDCVMHRDKARHGKPGRDIEDHISEPEDSCCSAPGRCAGMCETPSEILPAWQRAKVGDRIQHVAKGVLTVHAVDDTRIDRRLRCGPFFVHNENVLSILPPETEAPAESTNWNWGAGLRNEVAREQSALRAAIDNYRVPTAEPAAPVQDARELARQAIDELEILELTGQTRAVIDALDERGILSGAPKPTSINWNTALDTYYGAARAPNGTASDGLMAVLRLIPGLDVVEG